MWKHRLLNDFSRDAPVAQVLSASQEFYLGDYFDLQQKIEKTSKRPLSSIFLDEKGELLRLPYPLTLFSLTAGTRDVRQPLSFLCYQNPDIGGIRLFYFAAHRENNGLFSLCNYLTLVKNDGTVGWSGLPRAFSQPAPPPPDLAVDFLSRGCDVVSTGLALLNAKNVYSVGVEHNNMKKRNVRRQKQCLPLLERYHVLRFCPGRVVSKNASDGCMGQNIGSMPVHLCRGHFMHVSPERPLFGRPGCHGTFWVQPHVRGDKKNGVVVKDYEVAHEASK